MKALTLWQPWASLVACGVKTIETRSWSTSYRGALAIHAASTTKGFDALPGDCEGTTEAGWRYGYIGDFQAAYCYRTSDEGRRGEAYLHDLGSLGEDEPTSIPLGAVIATCRLADVVPAESVIWMPAGGLSGARHWGVGDQCAVAIEAEQPFGDYTAGRFAWLLNDIVPLPEPVPARGRQQLWEWAA